MTIIFKSGDQVAHDAFGLGIVKIDDGVTVVVRFEHGLEEVAKSDLRTEATPLQALAQAQWANPLEVITFAQAETIQSINDSWGVFAMSRIALLPHQLWVCKQVVEQWPTHWLVADDVGLGKTIEAGLILSALLSAGRIKRFLIVCPASLVEQWQERLRIMFDLRVTRYTVEADTPKADFWNTTPQVVASLQTLRLDSKERHKRLFESEVWDLVIVDEAHHVNADEAGGPTLGYKFVAEMIAQQRITSLVFFTGTPHRGKDFGFLALLELLRGDLFDPKKPIKSQLRDLRQVMIRNNKQNVTDLQGNKLFHAPIVKSETYQYSAEEAYFYDLLTEFILMGKLYANTLDVTKSNAVMLVLIMMQKLASSSVAAVRKALQGRLNRRSQSFEELQKSKEKFAQYSEFEKFLLSDEVSRLDEEIPEKSVELQLMDNEESQLRQLVAAAEAVTVETKITKIMAIVQTQFARRTILFFTEYKATQALLMSALIRHFGNHCVTFINGDNRIDGVIDSSGQSRTLYETREQAAIKFNTGQVRFLVSTEAGGEGIDLQQNCHTLLHVDLPWNPMRLHQRVGRLNRYGQSKAVEVMTLRNPDTVESLIWEKLNHKIYAIMQSQRQVMEDPEDLLQLILGMTTPSLFQELFSEATRQPRETLSQWFDQKAAQFGGHDALEAVKNLVGNYARFDFQKTAHQIPPLDLPDLEPFFTTMLQLNRRQVRREESGLSFITPDSWRKEIGMRDRYEELKFDRHHQQHKILGMGHKLMQQAIHQAKANYQPIALLPPEILDRPLLVFRVTDRITGQKGLVKTIMVGVLVDSTEPFQVTFLLNWQLLQKLNSLANTVKRTKTIPPHTMATFLAQPIITQAEDHLFHYISQSDLPFKIPTYTLLNVLLVG